MKLSKRQIGEANRHGGIELMIPWPDDLPTPDQARPATPAESALARTMLAPHADLRILRILAVQERRPRPLHPHGGEVLPHLAVWVVHQRYEAVTRRDGGQPPMMWVAG